MMILNDVLERVGPLLQSYAMQTVVNIKVLIGVIEMVMILAKRKKSSKSFVPDSVCHLITN